MFVCPIILYSLLFSCFFFFFSTFYWETWSEWQSLKQDWQGLRKLPVDHVYHFHTTYPWCLSSLEEMQSPFNFHTIICVFCRKVKVMSTFKTYALTNSQIRLLQPSAKVFAIFLWPCHLVALPGLLKFKEFFKVSSLPSSMHAYPSIYSAVIFSHKPCDWPYNWNSIS